MDKAMLKLLALKIEEYLIEDFRYKHLSGNLAETINIEEIENGYRIEIPAEIYDIDKWSKTGVIIYTGQGSYASQVDEFGGFSKTHTNYVERAINKAIQEWKQENGIEGVIR